MKQGSNPLFKNNFISKLKLTMIAQFMIDEVEGISILLGYKITPESTKALESLSSEDLRDYRNSLAEDFKVTTGKDILVVD